MADQKISALAAASSVVGANEFGINESGTNKKVTATQISTFVQSQSVGKTAIWVPISDMVPATTNGPSAATLETSSNKQNYKVLDFDATTQENAHFQKVLPKRWNEGTVSFRAVWSSTATDTDGVTWGLQASAISDNEAIDASWGTAQTIDDACQSAAGEVYVTDESAAITIAGSPALFDLLFFRVFRDVADSNDVATEDARLIGIVLFITTDAMNDA